MKHTNPELDHIIILGGGYAGLTAAHRLSKLQANASITLIDCKAMFQERIRFHQVATGQKAKAFQYRTFFATIGVQFVQAKAIALDANTNKLTLQNTNGAVETLSYNYLVYALGSTMDLDKVPGVREYAHTFNSLEDAQEIYKRLKQETHPQVLVVGGGLTGIETATEIAEMLPTPRVTLAMETAFSANKTPEGFSKKATDYLYKAFEKRNITLQTGHRVKSLKPGIAELSNGDKIPFDVCIWTSGFVAPPLAASSEMLTDKQGRIVTDPSLRSPSHPNIIAIGDSALTEAKQAGTYRMGSATALAMAPAAARTINALRLGKEPPRFTFSYLFRNISLGRDDGLIQFVNRHDVPRNCIWTGAHAARWKEFICNNTLSTMGLAVPEKLPSIPPLRMAIQLIRGQRQYE